MQINFPARKINGADMKFHLKKCIGCQRQLGKFKMSLVFLSLCCLFVGSKVIASELSEDKASGDITVVSGEHKKPTMA